MTCDEYQSAILNQCLYSESRAFRAAAIRHAVTCLGCMKWTMELRAKLADEGVTGNVTEEEKQAVIAADRADPEFVEVVFSKPKE